MQFSIASGPLSSGAVALLLIVWQTSRAAEVLEPDGRLIDITTRTLEPLTSITLIKLGLMLSLAPSASTNVDALNDATSPAIVKANVSTGCRRTFGGYGGGACGDGDGGGGEGDGGESGGSGCAGGGGEGCGDSGGFRGGIGGGLQSGDLGGGDNGGGDGGSTGGGAGGNEGGS